MDGEHQRMWCVQKFTSKSMMQEHEILDYGAGSRHGKGGSLIRTLRVYLAGNLSWKSSISGGRCEPGFHFR